MNSFNVLTALAVFVVVIFAITSQPPPQPNPVDHYWLVNLYPPSYCTRPQFKPCLNTSRAGKQEFSIHGLWPTDSRGKTLGGQFSKATLATITDITADPTLFNDMNKFWPDMNGGFVPYDDLTFWNQEWAKHGSADLANINQAVRYFRMTIAVRKLIPGADLTASLKKHNVIPGGSYSIATYRDAMEAETGVTDSIVMRCYDNPAGTFHLSEVRICVGRAATTVIGCNPLERAKENCGTGFVNYG